jgi:ABC-2 type transport system ATP-binding protein
VGLDPIGARMLRDIIRRLREQGKTVLLTTHYLYEADELCDRIAIINKGKLIALDTPMNLRRLVHGESSVEAVVDRIDEERENRIRSINGVRSVETLPNEKGIAVTVRYEIGSDISAELLSVLKTGKVYALTQKELTLEDVYISLVGGAE